MSVSDSERPMQAHYYRAEYGRNEKSRLLLSPVGTPTNRGGDMSKRLSTGRFLRQQC